MLLRTIARRFDLSVVHARSVMRAALFHFALVFGITAVKIATNALYLARRDPRDLPYLYLATAIVIAAVSTLVARRLAHLSAKPVLRSLLNWVAGAIVLCAALAAADLGPSLAVLYVLGEAYATALSVLFWARLGEVFDVRAQKRVFGVLSAAGMAGAVLAGLLVRALAGVVPSITWCFLAALVLVLVRPLLGAEAPQGPVRRERAGFMRGVKYGVGSPYPRAVAGLVLLISVQTAAVDFVFRTGSHKFVAGNEVEMAALFGVLNAVVGILAIGFQSTLTSTLMRRLGVFAYLGIVPAACVLAAGWSLAVPASLAPLFMLKVFEMMGSFSLYQPGLQLLYNPMPDEVRGSVRAFVDGTVKKVGGAVGGVVLLVAGAQLVDRDLHLLVIVTGLVLLLSIRLLRPLYVDALELKLGGREQAKLVVVDASDRSTRDELVKALSAGNEQQALTAISVLADEPGFDFERHIGKLVTHPAEAVRLAAIELIERAPQVAYAPFLESVILAPGRHPRASAARALMLVDPERARGVLEPILRRAGQSEDRALVAAAAIALLGRAGQEARRGAGDIPRGGPRSPVPRSSGGRSARSPLPRKPSRPSDPPGPRYRPLESALGEDSRGRSIEGLAAGAIVTMVERALAGTPSDRRELANVLAMIGPGRFASSLLPLLRDPHPGVLAAAVDAAAKAPDPELVPVLVELLDHRRLGRRVRVALAAQGDDAVPALARLLDDRRLDIGLRVQVPRILREIATPDAVSAMLYSNKDDDAYLRYVIIEELGRVRRRHPETTFDRAYTEAAALRRLVAYASYRPIAADLAVAPPGYGLLHRAVHDRMRQNLEAGLRVLGLLHDPQTMENVHDGLLREEVAVRSDALEVLDVALEGSDVRPRVIAQVEAAPPLGDASRAEARARDLVNGHDGRLAVLAHETLRRVGLEAPSVREPTSGEPLMPKSIVDKVFLLQGVQLFRGLSVDDLSAVAAITTEGHAEPRQVVYEQGQRGDSLYVVVAGEVHLLRNGAPLLDLQVGESFGQTSILDGGPRPVTAKAGDEGCDYVRLERQPLMDLMADRPELMSGLFVELAARIRELIELTEGQGKSGAAVLTRPSIPAESTRPGSTSTGSLPARPSESVRPASSTGRPSEPTRPAS